MSANKTVANTADVSAFVRQVEQPGRREDALKLLEFFDRVIGLQPCMWGESIIGYGFYHYKYDSGREGDYFLTGFSPRKSATTIYIMPGFKQYSDQLERLGPHKHSVSCLYITRLERVDLKVLEEIVSDSVRRMKEMYEWKEFPL